MVEILSGVMSTQDKDLENLVWYRINLLRRSGPLSYTWGERVLALASYGADRGVWGSLPPAYAAATPRAPADPPWSDDTDCPICLEAFDDVWPSARARSRAPAGRWACGTHAVCRTCDAAVQSAPNVTATRCPLCRATRHVFMQP